MKAVLEIRPITRVNAAEYVKHTLNGRTEPAILIVERDTGEQIEVIAKFSHRCEQKEKNLAAEVISACLAADLGIPIPRPYLVVMKPDFIDSLSEGRFRQNLISSNKVGFGSERLPSQFSQWQSGTKISSTMLSLAAAILPWTG